MKIRKALGVVAAAITLLLAIPGPAHATGTWVWSNPISHTYQDSDANCAPASFVNQLSSVGVTTDQDTLAQQMGTSVQMIEKHYGHVNTIRHADRVLMGMEGWNPVDASPDEVVVEGNAKGRESAKANQAPKAPSPRNARPASNQPPSSVADARDLRCRFHNAPLALPGCGIG